MRNRAALLGILSVGLLAVAFTQSEKRAVSNSNLTVPQIAGKNLFTLKKCLDCHTLGDKAEGKLTPVTNKRNDDFFSEHVKKESPLVLREEKSKRRQKRVLKAEIVALDEFLYNTKPAARKQIDEMTESSFEGAYFVYQNNCMNCHKIAEYGKDVGPDLSKVGGEHDKKWLVANLQDPKQFAEDTVMPKFDFLPKETQEAIAEYLSSLK